jgi:hypothetical protein
LEGKAIEHYLQLPVLIVVQSDKNTMLQTLIKTLFDRIRVPAPSDPRILEAIEQVMGQHLTYLQRDALLDLVQVAIDNEKRQIRGAIIETGCALGGSAIALTSAKSKQCPFYIYDVFGMIPPPSERDNEDVHERYNVILSGESRGIAGDKYYGYEASLVEKVRDNFARLGYPIEKNHVHLVQGLYQDTLKVNFPVSLAHIDCDWFDSVWTCLDQIVPCLVAGGRLVIDDYYTWSGCKDAVDQYFHDRRDDFIFVQKSRLHIVKQMGAADLK